MNKQVIMRSINKLLKPVRIQIVSAGVSVEPVHDPSLSFMKDSSLREALVDELGTVARSHFSTRLVDIHHEGINYTSQAREFLVLYSERPFKENIGGSGFHNAFWLFITARTLNPELIVESGVWRGHTTWLLEQACPSADVIGFDINLSRLEYKNGNARFYEHDWSAFQFEDIDCERSLVFFDCHVNHARRTIEASRRGFRHLIFDDNPPAHLLYAYGLPGFPTARMLWDGTEGLADNQIEWCWYGRRRLYKINMQEAAEARKIMKAHELFPDVGGFTRYGGFSYLTYVST